MRTQRIVTIAATLVVMAAIPAFCVFRGTQSARAESEAPPSPAIPLRVFSALADPTPDYTADYTVRPSDTDGQPADVDGNQPDCPGPGIGCEAQWGDFALNDDHFLYLPTSPSASNTSGKLLVFLGGGNGSARASHQFENLYPVAAGQGYHVIGLTYPGDLGCGNDPECFGDYLREDITGVNWSEASHISEHKQDSVVNRLIKVLEWACANHGDGGWGRYLTTTNGEHGVDWTQVHLAGFSNGSSHASLMGILYPDVARVALFSGPNDGKGGSAKAWIPATFIERVEGITDTHYYGLVHILNNSDDLSDDVLFKVTENWRKFGMEEPFNPPPKRFDPNPSVTTMDFLGEHMLISTDRHTLPEEAHTSIPRDRYCEGGHTGPCTPLGKIGYEPAWRCILGTGDAGASTAPVADAGVDQTLECQGSGGATIDLNGSGSRDPDCDVLSYTWIGPFGVRTSRKPKVFLPVGTSVVTLVVSDGWPSSTSSDTTTITVVDTQPPSLHVTLTPTSLWPANHRMVRINATVNAADSCGGPAPQVVLTSITSNQPMNGSGEGNTNGDIQEADFDTFDQSFLLRAERAGGDPYGRTYTVTYTATDASGNRTRVSATVHVPHSP